MNTLVSVVIPVLNSGKFLPETVDSVKNQTYESIELILVDNGSDDELTLNVLREQSKSHQVLYSGKTGVSNARNKGIEAANGDYILALDSDDLLDPTFVEKSVKVLDNNADIAIVRTHIEFFGSKKGVMKFATYSFPLLLARNLMVVTCLYRRKDWKRVGGYDTNFKQSFEDWELWINILKDGGTVYTIEEALFKYRIRRESYNHSIKREGFYNNRRLIWEKHKLLYGQYFVDPKETFEYKLVSDSKANKLGNILLAPFSKFKLMNQ